MKGAERRGYPREVAGMPVNKNKRIYAAYKDKKFVCCLRCLFVVVVVSLPIKDNICHCCKYTIEMKCARTWAQVKMGTHDEDTKGEGEIQRDRERRERKKGK